MNGKNISGIDGSSINDLMERGGFFGGIVCSWNIFDFFLNFRTSVKVSILFVSIVSVEVLAVHVSL